MHQELQFVRKLPGKFIRPPVQGLNDIQRHQIEGTLSKLELITEKVQISKRSIKIALLVWALVFVFFMMNGYRKYSMRGLSYGEEVADPRGPVPSSEPQSNGNGRLLQARPNPPNPQNNRRDPPNPPRGPKDQNGGPRPGQAAEGPRADGNRPNQNHPNGKGHPGQAGQNNQAQPRFEQPPEELDGPQDTWARPGRPWKRFVQWCWLLFPILLLYLTKRSKRMAFKMSCKLLEIENRYLIPYVKIKLEMKELEVLLVTVINDYVQHPVYPFPHGLQGENMPLRGVELPNLSDRNNTSFDI